MTKNLKEEILLKKELISTEEKESLVRNLRSEVYKDVTKGLKKEIQSDVVFWGKKWFALGMTGAGILGFAIGVQVSIPGIYKKIEAQTVESIKEKFAEPQIKKTINDVAANQAEAIIAKQIQPVADQAKNKIDFFERYLQEIKINFDKQYSDLGEQVSSLQNRNKLIQLADTAINTGGREAYDELHRISESENENLKKAATAEKLRVKNLYLISSRVKGVSFDLKKPDGSKMKDDEIPTQLLIQILNGDSDWRARILAANLLGTRKEKNVPEALLSAIKNDKSLDVLKSSLESFQRITEHQNPDILDHEWVFKWWEDNKKDVLLTLNEPPTGLSNS